MVGQRDYIPVTGGREHREAEIDQFEESAGLFEIEVAGAE